MRKTACNFLISKERRIVKRLRLKKIIGKGCVSEDLIYTRSITPNYIKKTEQIETPLGYFLDVKSNYPEDFFDKLVLEAVRQNYPDVIVRNADINTGMDIQRFVNIYSGRQIVKAIVSLQPSFRDFECGCTQVSSFRVPLEIYVCADYQEFFANQVFSLDFEVSNMQSIRKELQKLNPPIHTLSESIRKRFEYPVVISV